MSDEETVKTQQDTVVAPQDAAQGRFAVLDTALMRVAVLKEGISHHIDIWREAVKADRLRPRQSPIGHAELAFLPAALEVSETPASPLARATAITIAAFVVMTIAWACIGDLDIVATAPGKVVPSERVKTIQPLETSIVRAVNVIEGQEVKAGDLLVALEVTGGSADVARLKAELNNARMDSARLTALLSEHPERSFVPPVGVPEDLITVQKALLSSQFKEQQARLEALEAELSKRKAELKTIETDLSRLSAVAVKIKDETERRQELASKGYGSQIDRARSEKELAENQGQQQVNRARLAETKAAMESTRGQLAQAREEFRRDITTKLAETRTKVMTSEQELAKASERQQVQNLRAPVDGVVQQIETHTIGGVVTPAQKLMVVVPRNAVMEVEAKLPNKDIGFVEVGQIAEVKVDSFPFTKYGTLTGRVELVSLDAVKDEESQTKDYSFPIRVSIADPFIRLENGKRVPLSPGMTVVAEVKTGTRKPIEYVLAPLQKYGAESGRER
ncbi:HlyD family type I secretion periplasmic adaptor subunit [Insolitispirillum peregrinum]|uniref:Membrane fusion protein (MFP) family protein n=1 Tax=Insolitispirillum peregrinum TaxID=80876 RepID=A0A1N7PP09_9PROT|nr:HlyD family type I secretion periplasmic adaptor subunit [Insolitispirillum peregrinum]SIT12393.1 hemolysin D [Insolitispirillum peregrinum]